MTEHSLLLDLGLVLFFGFLGAWLASRLGQSVIVGYIVLGTVIGPNVLGLVGDDGLIHVLSELGVVFLMFFLGLEFSVARFAQIKNSALVVGSAKIAAQMGAGLLLGLALGWSDIDRWFLAAIIAISSSGVTAKLLFDLKRTATRDAEVLMGIMVFEDFVAIVAMGALIGIAATGLVQTGPLAVTVGKVFLFYALAILVAAKVFPRIAAWLEAVDSEELFVAVVAAAVLLAGAGAVAAGLPSAAGAFVLGMIVNNKALEERIHQKIAPFRDAFLVVFFLAFGMLIDPAMIPPVLGLLAAVVGISLAVELVVSSSLAFLSGLPAAGAVAVGTGLVSRGEYAMLYAALGQQAGAISSDLYQLTGAYVFTMTLLAPLMMRNARRIKAFYSSLLPRRIKRALILFSNAMGPLMFPDLYGVKPPSYRYLFAGAFIAYLAVVIRAFGLRDPYVLAALAAAGLGLSAVLVWLLRKSLTHVLDEAEELPFEEGQSPDRAHRFVLRVLGSVLVGILVFSVFWGFNLPAALAVLGGLLLALVRACRRVTQDPAPKPPLTG
ncbi:MAG: cation:proton antiporter [Thermoanaerobacterales bacterium]|nr:cation:proton antiporter [Bacillota bacterium]MDI6907238.1 cation:proton antiporter [Thermoanaerobacterales bacterium]